METDTTTAPEIGSMDYWRDAVERWAKARLAECPGKSRARQVNDPETAAKVLYLISLGTSKKRTAKETGVSRLEIGRIVWHHRSEMDACRAAAAG